MNILILAAGHPEFDTRDGNYPLCLTEFNGVPMLERIVNACKPLGAKRIIFALRKDEVNRYHLDSVANLLSPVAVTLKVEGSTPGAACTALLAAGHIDSSEELLVMNANELVDADLEQLVAGFRARKLDAATVTFTSIHPRYSYVRLGPDGMVTEATEKNPISNHATAGLYWYARGSDFVAAVKNMIRKDAHVDGMFYICPAFNELVLKQAHIGTTQIDAAQYHPLKTERQLHQFESVHDVGVRT
jgi:NDP-sugar pyrophosphorylase family protein